MKIEIEYNSKVDNASQHQILNTVLTPYLKWKWHKTFKNYMNLVTSQGDYFGYYVHRFFICARYIINGRYETILHQYVSKITLDFEYKEGDKP